MSEPDTAWHGGKGRSAFSFGDPAPPRKEEAKHPFFPSVAPSAPRLGFAGVGGIGRNRLAALAESTSVQIVAVVDPDETCVRACREIVPGVQVLDDFQRLLAQDLDAVVIATPSALHAEQAIAAFHRGWAVFCQEPLGRDAAEVRRVIEAARRADRLLGVDLSYRCTRAVVLARNAVQSGRVGRLFHVELVLHSARGPGRPWSYDRRLAGGGACLGLGAPLVDLALWTMGFPQIVDTHSRLYSKGVLLQRNSAVVEDFATAQLLTEDDADIRLQCSWDLHPGGDMVMAARFYGDQGAALIENVNGSSSDFRARLCKGAKMLTLAEPPDPWLGRAAVEWAHKLRRHPRFDPEAQEHLAVAEVLDGIYGRATLDRR
jgi:predicted dehydrogenase